MEGNPNVERLMESVSEAIYRHIDSASPAAVDIYNRAYEAVDAALKEAESTREAIHKREQEIVKWLRHWTEINEPEFERIYGIRQSGVNIPNLRHDLESWLNSGKE